MRKGHISCKQQIKRIPRNGDRQHTQKIELTCFNQKILKIHTFWSRLWCRRRRQCRQTFLLQSYALLVPKSALGLQSCTHIHGLQLPEDSFIFSIDIQKNLQDFFSSLSTALNFFFFFFFKLRYMLSGILQHRCKMNLWDRGRRSLLYIMVNHNKTLKVSILEVLISKILECKTNQSMSHIFSRQLS